MPDYDPECLFCRIARREIPATLVHADDAIVAFRDINPQAPTHVLVIPTRHAASLDEASADPAALGALLAAVPQIAAREGLTAGGYRTVINTGANAGQSVAHLHVHILGGRQLGWPPG